MINLMGGAILYLRVSSEDQIKNFSLDTQLSLCKSFADRKGYQVLEVFREEGESAKTVNRPQLYRLFEYCRKNQKKIQTVLVYKFDRVARNTSDHLAIKARLAEYGIKLESISEPIDDTPTGRFMETLLAGFAQLDNEVRGERARAGLHSRFLAGLTTKPPLGYKNIEINGRKIHVEDDETYELVKKSWELMATGTQTLSEMAKEMNNKGLRVTWKKRKRLLTKQYASKLFSNKFYMGILESKQYPDQHVKGLHVPMISEEMFYRVQSVIKGRNQVPFGLKRAVINPLFPLRGVVKCSCGTNLVSGEVKGRSKHYPKYWCPDNCIPSIDAELLEKKLKIKLREIQPNEDLVNAFTLFLYAKYQTRKNTLIDKKKIVEKEIAEQKAFMVLLVRGNMTGKYPDDIFQEEKKRIEDKLLTLQIASNDSLCDQYDIDRTVNFIKALFKDLVKAYEASDIGQKRILLGSIYPSGLVFDGQSLLNHEIGAGYRAIQDFSNQGVAFCRGKRT